MVRIWDAQTGLESPAPLRGLSPVQSSLTFAPDARVLLAADIRGIVQPWTLGRANIDIAQWQAPPPNGQAPRLAFLTDGQRFVTYGENGAMWRWHVAAETGIPIATSPYGCCVGPNGHLALVSPTDGEVAIYDLDTAKQVGALEKTQAETPDLLRVADVAVTPDEQCAVVLHGVNRPRSMRMYSLQSDLEVMRLPPHDGARIAIAPDGQHLLTTDYDGAVSMFDLHTGSFVRKIDISPELALQPAVFSPDGKLAAFVHRTTVTVIEVPSGNRVKEWSLPGPIEGVAFAPDGRHLALGNANGTIYVMRLVGGKER
jgi:WD40 repeat protein